MFVKKMVSVSYSGKSCTNNNCVTACEEGWEQNGSHCYFWSTTAMTWPDAEEYCRNQSGHLASVTSNTTNDYVEEGKQKRDISRLWIGGSDSEAEGTWRWADCSLWDFTVWKVKQPDNLWGAQNCLNHLDQRWDDQRCKNPARFLCSQIICPESDMSPLDTTTLLVAIGGSALAGLLILVVVVLCALKRRRSRKNATDVAHTDENPVYGTYFDPDPKAEVADGNTYYKIMYSDS